MFANSKLAIATIVTWLLLIPFKGASLAFVGALLVTCVFKFKAYYE